MNEAGILLIVLVLGLAVLTGPILGLIALVRLRRLEQNSGTALSRELASMHARLVALENAAPPPVTPAPASAPEPIMAKAPPPARPAAPAPPARGIDWESIVAGRWLNRVGIVAILLAAAFFLKYAFDNDWIGPAGRVAIGLVCGAGLLVYSRFLLKRGYLYFSEGIAGTGAGILYLSIYAAWGYYELVPQSVAFAGMVVVTGALVTIAIGRNSQRLALLAQVGGLLTPGLLSTGQDQQVALFTYLLVLNAGVLAVARARTWRWLEPLGLVGTLLYFVPWFDAFYEPSRLASTLIFASLFFVQFATLAALRARRGAALLPEHYAIVLANAAWFMLTLHLALYDDHRWGLTFAVLALAAAHLVVLRLLPEGSRTGRPAPERLLYAGIAVTLFTIAIPIRLEGEWITLAWTIEGAVLVWSGFRASASAMRGMGLVLFVLVVVRLLTQDVDAPVPFANARFATFATAIAAFAAAFFVARSRREQLARDEEKVFGAVGVMANALGVWGLSLEAWDFFDRARFGGDHQLAQQMGLSVLWTLLAVVLILVGVRRASPALRWQGLVLLGIAVGKAFLFDLSFLARIYRILTFLALGVVALIVSFLYQRRLSGEREDGEP